MFNRVRAAYAEGNLNRFQSGLAMNFLLDRSAENWAAEFARLKAAVGRCSEHEKLTPTGALSANFRLICERGQLDGQLLLAPTEPITLQALRFRVVEP